MSFLIPRDLGPRFLNGTVIMLMVSIMIISSESRKRDRDDDRYLFILLALTCFSAISETVGYLFEEKTVPGSWILSTIGMTLFFIFFVMIGVVWNHYCRIRFKFRGVSAENIMRPANIPGAVMMVVILINVFTGWIFKYDENAFYHRGPLYILVYIVMFAYVIAGFAHLIGYRTKRSGRSIIPIWVYVVPTVASFVFTFAIPGSASFAPLGIALCVAFTHIGTTNEVFEISYEKK